MFLKTAGSLAVMGAAVLWGFLRAAELKDQYHQMEYLYQLICRLQSEMRYGRTHLSEILSCMGCQLKEPYKSWFIELESRLQARDGGTLDEVWRQSTGTCLRESGLPKEELEHLSELGGQLGNADLEMQMKTLDICLMRLSISMKEHRKELGSRMQLCRWLGVAGGMLVVILLL